MTRSEWFLLGAGVGIIVLRVCDIFREVRSLGIIDDLPDAGYDEELEEHLANWRKSTPGGTDK
jgi:hypothetical protein